MTAAERDSQVMRHMLRTNGIYLDDPPTITHRDLKPVNVPELEVDREQVRAALITADAPAEDLEWLVPSCPSLEEARAYRPTARVAWCAICGDAAAVDERGCVGCRAAQSGHDQPGGAL